MPFDHANYSILMVVVDAARLFSAGLRIIQPTIAAIKLRIPPINSEIGAPKSSARPPANRFPSGIPPAYTIRKTLITRPRKCLGVTICSVVFAVADNTICAHPTLAIKGKEKI